ncbi:GH92 family glycosyl hydrolase [Bacteroidia bacterium]|nr:GH92 family glycosyl hydrolase [Bacteroidia bacterium]MDC1395748.1 GH92 family glycosyl hydrolase [Bacteroidia bacterium]
MRLTLIFIFLTQLVFAQSNYINPFIGTGGHGHTFPGATVPFGMVQLSPDTRIDGSWDGCSGYHYSDSFIYGFSHTHLSGTGVSDYGDILLLPSVNTISFEPEEYKTKFRHEEEVVTANYYEVNLPDNGVRAKLTTALRSGLHQYVFDKNAGYVLLDLKHRDKTLDFKIEEVGKQGVLGFRVSEGWAKEQHCYFYLEFDQGFESMRYNSDSSKAVFYFENLKNNTLGCSVGLSFTGSLAAYYNLYHDSQSTYKLAKFDVIMEKGKKLWDKELSKIEVFTEDENKKHVFYTALYHCMIHPNIAEDVDGKYRGHDGKIHDSPNHTQYTVFSLWDTYRALHPLMTIIDEQRTTDFINSFLEIYKQSGRLPVWELASNETDCMIGYHSVSVIADAYMKGIIGFDTTLALEAMVASANEDIFGLPSYRKYGFVRAEDESESVSKTLEYAYDDWCIAQMANRMGEDSVANVFYRRAESWRNIINLETGFATPRLNGDWLLNFDPKEVNLHFTEANSWQYSFVQHEPGRLSSSEDLEKRLDALFSEKEQTTGRTQSDITGLIGQYAHGNEPSHHIAYLYNYTKHPEKGQKIIKHICDSFYTNSPDGLIGNEDCGQMSAWYVMSSSGFYSVYPGSNIYSIGQCEFDSVVYNLNNDNRITIIGSNRIGNGACKEFTSYDIRDGLYLNFSDCDYGDSFSDEGWAMSKITLTPIISGEKIFSKQTEITLTGLNPLDEIYYRIESEDSYKKYSKPFLIEKTSFIEAYAQSIRRTSPIISATFYKKPNNWSCTPSIQPNKQYTGGGEDALTDGIRGTTNWQAGRWQGYQNEEVTFDLEFKDTKKVSLVSASFVQDARSWILMPSKVEIYCEGKLVGSKSYAVDAFTDGNFLETLSVKLKRVINTDNLQVKIYSAGKLPKGHQGHSMGGDGFFFVDEISIRE